MVETVPRALIFHLNKIDSESYNIIFLNFYDLFDLSP